MLQFDNSVACWSASSIQPTLALVAMACLAFYVITSNVMVDQSGLMHLQGSSSELDIRYSQVYIHGLRSAKVSNWSS